MLVVIREFNSKKRKAIVGVWHSKDMSTMLEAATKLEHEKCEKYEYLIINADMEFKATGNARHDRIWIGGFKPTEITHDLMLECSWYCLESLQNLDSSGEVGSFAY